MEFREDKIKVRTSCELHSQKWYWNGEMRDRDGYMRMNADIKAAATRLESHTDASTCATPHIHARKVQKIDKDASEVCIGMMR